MRVVLSCFGEQLGQVQHLCAVCSLLRPSKMLMFVRKAMVHELIGIDLNRVDLSRAPDVKLDEKEVVLSQEEDAFFRNNLFANFGDIGNAVKALMGDFQRQHQSAKDLKSGGGSVEDIQKIVDNFPELKKNSNDVAKHVTLMSELARLVEARSLMKVSALEQDICCGDGHAAHVR